MYVYIQIVINEISLVHGTKGRSKKGEKSLVPDIFKNEAFFNHSLQSQPFRHEHMIVA